MELIIEYRTNDKDTPVVRVIYFKIDEDTDAPICEAIREIDVETMNPAYTALHHIDWCEVTGVRFNDVREGGMGEWAKFTLEEFGPIANIIRLTSIMLSMVKLDYKGFRDWEGNISNGNPNPDGSHCDSVSLMEGYHAYPDGDLAPYHGYNI